MSRQSSDVADGGLTEIFMLLGREIHIHFTFRRRARYLRGVLVI